RRRHTRFSRDWSSDVCSSDLLLDNYAVGQLTAPLRWGAMLLGVFLARRLLPLQEQTFDTVRHGALLTAILIVGWTAVRGTRVLRSEERRVGKECRYRWWRVHK